MTVTHFVKFADEATAKAALPSYWSTSDTGWDWNRSIVDGPIPVMIGTGVFTTDPLTGQQVETKTAEPGYHLNIGLPALNAALVATPGFLGARDATGLITGTAPITPQRVFA